MFRARKTIEERLAFTMTVRLKNKVAIITGGSRGIGRATSSMFARQGAAVVVNFRENSDKASQVVEEIHKAGGRAIPVQADVSDKSAVSAMVEKTISQFGQIDILINNAGIFLHGTVLTTLDKDLDQLIAINLKGIFHCVQAVAPHMMKHGYGKIVNVSSIAALATTVANTTAYATTKAAVNVLTKRMAFELSPHGINVNSVAPGFILTDMTRRQGERKAMEERFARTREKTLLKRNGEPEDIAHVILFLSTDEASFITGQILLVDGGRTDILSYSA